MKVKIKRIDKTLPLPEYKTSGAAAFDMYSRIDLTVKPKEICRIPSNLIIKTPPGYMLLVVPRSSTPKKYGLSILHGIGLIDPDFSGADDEILLQMYNFTDAQVRIPRGTRICQGVFVKIDLAQWKEVNEINGKTRGGFGTTGH